MRLRTLVALSIVVWAVACAARPAPNAPTVPAPAPAAAGPLSLEALAPGAAAHGFTAEKRYTDDAGRPAGGRFRHTATGFEIDYLRIESAPQVFDMMSIGSPLRSNASAE